MSREVAARLAAHIEAWLPALADRPMAEPAWGWFGELTRDKHERSREQIRARLTWMLEPSETLLTVLCGSANAWNKRNGYAVITDKRILLCKDGDFDERAAIDQELPWNSVSSMLTLAKGPMGGPDLVLKCTDQPRQIQLRDYTNHDELRALLDRFVDAKLQSAARTTAANRAETAALPVS